MFISRHLRGNVAWYFSRNYFNCDLSVTILGIPYFFLFILYIEKAPQLTSFPSLFSFSDSQEKKLDLIEKNIFFVNISVCIYYYISVVCSITPTPRTPETFFNPPSIKFIHQGKNFFPHFFPSLVALETQFHFHCSIFFLSSSYFFW